LEKIQKKKHRLRKQNFEIALIFPADESSLQPLELTHTEPDNLSIPDSLEITGFPPGDIDTELLENYLENSRSGGCAGAVVGCSIVSPGTVHVKLQSQEGIPFE